jgi:hypothetical protein
MLSALQAMAAAVETGGFQSNQVQYRLRAHSLGVHVCY